MRETENKTGEKKKGEREDEKKWEYKRIRGEEERIE